MKVYISVDIEGITGVTSWRSTVLGDKEHGAMARQMTLEAVAACEAAVEMGADEVYIKDAHDSGRNLDMNLFPREAKIIYDWAGVPESMIACLDETFDAVMYVGYHSPAGLNGSPLSHTMNRNNNYVKINGQLASEFLLHAYAASHYGVPSVFVSGDKMLCDHVKAFDKNIETVAVKEGLGNATINLSPSYSCQLIREGVKKGLQKISVCQLPVPEKLELEINYKDHATARRAAFYPGARLLEDGYTIIYPAASILDLMTARMFIL